MAVDETGRTDERRSDFDDAYGSWDVVREHAAGLRRNDCLGSWPARSRSPRTNRPGCWNRTRSRSPWRCCHAEGVGLDAVTRLADDVRRDTVGDEVTFVVNRNINFTNVCYTGCRFCAFAQRRTDPDAYSLSLDEVAARAREAWEVGATEVCLQGGIDPAFPGSAYGDLVRAVKREVPQLHMHAFSPMEVVNGAIRTGLSIGEFLQSLKEAGLDTLPGTAAEILDDDVRWILTKGKLPTASWIEVITAAHRLGLRTSSTMMFGHVDQPRHWLQHFRVLAGIQDETGGFTEFVPLLLRPPLCAPLPGRRGPAGSDSSREPGGPRRRPVAPAWSN